MSNSISSAPYVAQVGLDEVVVQVHVDDAKRDAKRHTQLLNLTDHFCKALFSREAQVSAVRPPLRELRGLRTEAAEWEAANPPLQRRRATRCGLATSLAGLAVMASGALTGSLVNDGLWMFPGMLTGGMVFSCGLLTCCDTNHNPFESRIDSKQQEVWRQQDILAQAHKALVSSHTKLTNSMYPFMIEQVTHHTALTSAEARIVAEFVGPNVYLDDGSYSILGLDGATAQATTATPAVDSKSHAAAQPSASAGDGDRAEGRVQERQRLLGDVTSADRNRSDVDAGSRAGEGQSSS